MDTNSKILPSNFVATNYIPTQQSTTGGSSQETSIKIPLSEQPPITQPDQQFLLTQLSQRYCGLERLPDGKIIKGEEIGKGGVGVVYKGTLIDETAKTIDIVIKEPNARENRSALIDETQTSSDLMNDAKANLTRKDNLASSQEGFANVVFQQAINGQHVQRRIDGCNGYDAIYNKQLDLYNTPTGHPKNIEQPLMLAQQLLNAIHALHEQGFAHCDIKPRNIMIEITPNGIKLTVIDLGGAAQFGQNAKSVSLNFAPEAFPGLRENKLPKATPQFDIYLAGIVLCELLFGRNKNIWISQFWAHFNGSRIPCLSKYQSNEHPKLLLQKLLQAANKLPDGSMLYPPAIFNTISDLICKMCEIDPAKRLSLQRWLPVLNDLALCAEAIGHYDRLKAKESLSDEDEQLLAQLKPQAEKFKNEKPMIVGTLSQAIQLISDLNELNKKGEDKLTPAEKDTIESLLYNLQRDFEISPDNDTLNTKLKEAITTVTCGFVLQSEELEFLQTACRNDIEQQIETDLSHRFETAISLSPTNPLATELKTELLQANDDELLD